MDPATFLGSLSAAGTILAGITTVVKNLCELKERFRDADTTVGLLVTELSSITAALNVVQKWSKDGSQLGPIQVELAGNFELSIEGCRAAVALLSDDVTILHTAFIGDERNVTARIKALWKDSALKDRLEHLRSQVSALKLLIDAVQLFVHVTWIVSAELMVNRLTPEKQAERLNEPENRIIIERMKDDTSSLRTLLRCSRSDSQTITTRTESIVDERRFEFDEEVQNSTAYRNNRAHTKDKRRPTGQRPTSASLRVRERTEAYTSSLPIEPKQTSREPSPLRDNREKHSEDVISDGKAARRSSIQQRVAFARKSRHCSSASQSGPGEPSGTGATSTTKTETNHLEGRSSQERTGYVQTSPSIAIHDTDSSLNSYGSSPPSSWAPPGSSQSSLVSGSLQRSASTYSWQAEPSSYFRSDAISSAQRPPQTAPGSPQLGLWGTIRKHPSVANFFLFPRSPKTPNPSSPLSPPGSHRGRKYSENDTNRSVDLTKEALPGLVAAAQDNDIHDLERLLRNGENIEATSSLTRRTALAVASHCGNTDLATVLLSREAKIDTKDLYGMTPLHLAAERGHLESARLLLEWGAPKHATTTNGRTPLRLAVDNHRHDVAKLLLKNGAHVDSRDHAKLTALHAAAKLGDPEMVNLLVANDADLEARDGDFMAAIHYAAKDGHTAVVEIFLSKRVNVDYPGKQQTTPLMIACSEGQIEVADFLMKKKANVRQTSDGGMTPLHWACTHGRTNAVKLLLQKKAVIDARNFEGCTPLHMAIMSHSFDTVDFLLRHKAAREADCSQGWRPIHYACNVGDIEIIQLLLNNKVDIEAATRQEQRPIHLATLQGSLQLVELLIRQGATRDCLDKNGERPLTLACMNGNLHLVQMLLHYGSAPRLKFRPGPSHEDSPLCVAVKYGHENIVRELIERGASVTQSDERGWQPLRYAAYQGHATLVDFLLEHGASVCALQLGTPNISNTSRIKFATDVREDVKPYILERLELAEAEERSAQEVAEKVDYPQVHGYAEMDSENTPTNARHPWQHMFSVAFRNHVPSRPNATYAPAMYESSAYAPYVDQHQPDPQYSPQPLDPESTYAPTPYSTREAFQTSSGLSTPAFTPLPNQTSPPRRAQTTRPRSTISGVWTDDTSRNPSSITNVTRSITIATPRAPAQVRSPPVLSSSRQVGQNPGHRHLQSSSYTPMQSNEAYSTPSPRGPNLNERAKLFKMTCMPCKALGKEVPDWHCPACFQKCKDFKLNVDLIQEDEDEHEDDLYAPPTPTMQVHEMWAPVEDHSAEAQIPKRAETRDVLDDT